MKVWLAVLAVVGCSSHPSRPPVAAAPAGPFPVCSGQTAESAATSSTPRAGETTQQLAPSFLDRMPACGEADIKMPAELVTAGAGAVNAKGDCEWTSGVKCHFHFGAEFVVSGAPRPQVGELHCILPTSEPKSPHVFGTHFTCKAGTAVSHEHASKAGAACGAELLTRLATAMPSCDAKCCDDGTLTATADERRTAGMLDLRPDFRMCSQTVELDCAALATTAGRPANAPSFGPPVTQQL
jgi:hypothetical protein